MEKYVNLQSMLRVLVIVLTIVDVLLQGHRPGNVVNLRDKVAIEFEGAKELRGMKN